MIGEGFAFARWYCLAWPLMSEGHCEWFNRVALDVWRDMQRAADRDGEAQ